MNATAQKIGTDMTPTEATLLISRLSNIETSIQSVNDKVSAQNTTLATLVTDVGHIKKQVESHDDAIRESSPGIRKIDIKGIVKNAIYIGGIIGGTVTAIMAAV